MGLARKGDGVCPLCWEGQPQRESEKRWWGWKAGSHPLWSSVLFPPQEMRVLLFRAMWAKRARSPASFLSSFATGSPVSVSLWRVYSLMPIKAIVSPSRVL